MMDEHDLRVELAGMTAGVGAISACVKPGSKYFHLRKFVLDSSGFLPQETPFKIRFQYALNGITEMKRCGCGCGGMVIDPRNNFLSGHGNRSAIVKERKKKSCMDRHGVENPSQLQAVKDAKRETSMKRYGVGCHLQSKDVQESIARTNLGKYGSENVFGSEEIKEKIRKTNMERYGVETPMENADVVERVKQTNLERYGSTTPLGNADVLKKMTETNMERHGVPYILCRKDINRTPKDNAEKQRKIKESRRISTYEKMRLLPNVLPNFPLDEFVASGSGSIYSWKCRKCGTIFDHPYLFPWLYNPTCPTCSPISNFQEELYCFISKISSETMKNTRKIISPLELDIYAPAQKIAVECDGLHWHGELNGMNRLYHLEKTRICNESGIRLIHVFEDEWTNKKRIVKSRLKNIFGQVKYSIFARKCSIRLIDDLTKERFLDKYHIQGNDVSSIRIGAFYKNRLVAVMTFGKLRVALGMSHIEGSYELSRFCSISNFTIVGIGNKMLTYFERNFNPKSIISYADRRWSEGGLYHKMGFSLDHISRPNYWYFKGKHRFHRFNFRKNVLKEKLVTFDENLSEWENMKNNKWDRIWDCGNLVFKKNY